LKEFAMSMLAAPDTITGPLRAEDLDRNTNPGNVWLMPRRAYACSGNCRQGRDGCDCIPDTVPTDYGVPGWLDSCAPEGGKAREPVAAESMLRHRRHAATIKAAAALAVVVVVVGYVFQVI
jgi:hypothetical protein